jgi:beta-N-acetylhexosaminidase
VLRPLGLALMAAALVTGPSGCGLLGRDGAGLVLTDSLSALAVTDAGYSVPQAAARSIEAGADMVLFDSVTAATTEGIIASIVSAVASGRLPASRLDNAVQHVLAAKNISLGR